MICETDHAASRMAEEECMTVDNRFWKKKFEQFEQLFALYSQATNLPFLVCDPETFDDQVYVSSDKSCIQELAQQYADQKYRMLVVEVPKPQIQRFLAGLYAVGANALIVQEGGLPVRVELKQLVPEPGPEDAAKGKIPKRNPQVQLTALYFLQELRRAGERTPEERQKLRSLEEEMAVNLMKSRFILALDITEIKGKWDPKDPSQKAKIPFVKDKAGNIFLPCYSDLGEFEKFNAKNKNVKFCLLSIPYEELPKYLLKESKGFVFNPAGFHLILTREAMENMKKNYA